MAHDCACHRNFACKVVAHSYRYCVAARARVARVWWARYLKSFEAPLDLLGAKETPLTIVGYQALVVAALIIAWLVFGLSYAALLIPAVVPLTYVALRVAHDQRCLAIALQLDGWLLLLANMLAATGSVGGALSSSADLIGSPLKEEVELLLKQIEVGTTIQDALANMHKRVPSKGLHTVVTSLRVGRRLGGDLPTLLAENAATLRESERIDRFIRTQVSQGKVQLLVLAAAPLGLMYLFEKSSPGYFRPLLDFVLGPYIIVGCALMWIAALVIGFKIMDVDA